jgi:uncharacterized membrane protein (Fun14 family)
MDVNNSMIDIAFVPQRPTLVQSIKNVDTNGIINAIKDMNFNWVQMGVFFAIGSLSGYLFKKYFRTFFVWIICGLGLVAALEYAGLIAIDWNAVQGLIGVAPAHNVDTVVQSWLVWSQVNMSLLVCGIVGFIFGYKAA